VILFWLICAALVLIALAFILPTALQRSDEAQLESEDERKKANIAVYRDQLSELQADVRNGIVSEEQYAQDREEIERRLLEDISTTTTKKAAPAPASVRNRALVFALINPLVAITYYFRFKNTTPAPVSAQNTAFLLGIGLPLVAVILYLTVGTPKSISEPPATGSQSAVPAAAPQGRTQEQIEANVDKLAKRLESNPSDVQGWTMLARSYSSMGKFGEAAGAYAKATELTPKDADLWAEYAFATAMANGRSMEGRPMELIQQALKVDPENAKALQLAGSAAFQAGDYKKAIDYWERVLKQVPPNSEAGQAITGRINEAKTLAAGSK
jgi:cytochrome c-type biogenesis protein CcmH